MNIEIDGDAIAAAFSNAFHEIGAFFGFLWIWLLNNLGMVSIALLILILLIAFSWFSDLS